ncbi:hypothetical protein COT42_00225 [Candidatus Saganbacteria bacterium CG08_land_8_20_14_0_20_45_16]|uniref:Uncharacterized protein n=1 Tax=Candidatus Saganbacteria bacterium CG08_land_8_20_14_0_20_45_16 TaxID=2014293 RepID=A0A2H0Y1Z7_UNCSA|nr:MAG: hypothetical protein COT42_00225 [Candidatus Saganbacteria bacterium CG08_land_8_20_14_0_20_45_16]
MHRIVNYNRPIFDRGLSSWQARFKGSSNPPLVSLRRRKAEVASFLRAIQNYRRMPIGAGKFTSGVKGDYKVKANERFAFMGYFEFLTAKVYASCPKSKPNPINAEINLIFSKVFELMDGLQKTVFDKVLLDVFLLGYVLGTDSTKLDRASEEYRAFAAKMDPVCQKHSWETIRVMKQIDHELDRLLALFGLTVDSKF